jgi:hypothetical protein
MAKIEKICCGPRSSLWHLPFLIILFFPLGQVFCQPAQREAATDRMRIDDVNFRFREVESVRLLEVHVKVFNPSQKVTIPANSIRLALIAREVSYSGTLPQEGLDLPPETTPLHHALPPKTGCILITAFSLPNEKVESITFEIQINPAEGEKKTVTWKRE